METHQNRKFMKNKILLLLIIGILNGYSFSQERKSPHLQKSNLPEFIPFCFKKDWGYYNTKTGDFGNLIFTESINKTFKMLNLLKSLKEEDFDVKLEYNKYYIVDKTGNKKLITGVESHYKFIGISEGLACFSTDNKQKFINKNAEVVLEVKYSSVSTFSEGKAVVSKGDKYGFINKSGKVVIPLKFQDARSFGNGLAPVKVKNYWGFIDTLGKLIIPPIYEDAEPFFNGLAWVNYDYNSYGYIDIYGNEYFPRKLIPFRKGTLWGFYIYTDYNRSKKKIVIQPGYHSITDNYDGTYIVSFNKKYGVLNFAGKEIVPVQYDYIDEIGDYFKVFVKSYNSSNKYGLFGQNGEKILEPIYDDIILDCNKDGMINENDRGFILYKDNKQAFYNLKGKEIVPFICDGSMGIRLVNDMLYVKINEKKGVIDLNGNTIIPPKYDDFSFFSQGYASYMREGKWGHLDTLGVEIIPPTYDERYYFTEGLAKVKKGNKYGFINKKGEVVVPLVYDNAQNFNYGFAAVERGNLWGFVNKNGQEVIPCSFNDVYSFDHPNYAVVKKGKKYGVINNLGEFVLQPNFDWISMKSLNMNTIILNVTYNGINKYFRVWENKYCESDQYGNCK